MIASDIALPGLLPGDGAEPDVVVTYGPVPETLPDASSTFGVWQAGDGAVLLTTPDGTRFLVRGGDSITVDRADGATDDGIRVYLLGTVLAALLQQRGMLTLHSSAVATPQGAVLFAGKSGAGKSTLLGGMVRRGYAMLCDDVAAIDQDGDGVFQVHPAFPTARLWSDSVAKLGHDEGRLRRVRKDLAKFHLPMENFCAETLPLHAIYMLTAHNGDAIDIQPAGPADRLKLLNWATYRRRVARGQGQHASHFRMQAEIAQRTPMSVLRRPAFPFDIDSLADRVIADLAGLAVEPA